VANGVVLGVFTEKASVPLGLLLRMLGLDVHQDLLVLQHLSLQILNRTVAIGDHLHLFACRSLLL
jgi:hypothetical protein